MSRHPWDVLEPARIVASAAIGLGGLLAPVVGVLMLPAIDVLLAVCPPRSVRV